MRQDSKLSSQRPPNAALRGIHINISSDPFQHRIPSYFQRLWQESKLRKGLSVCKRRLTKRFHRSNWIELGFLGFSLFACCIILLIHVGFFSGGKYQDWQHDHYEDSLTLLEEVDLLEKVYPDEGRLQTTAVVLVSKQEDIQTVESIVKRLCEYDMFNSFVIWNDNPKIQLTNDMIKGCYPNKINIINTPTSMGVSARYYACQSSKTAYCFFQDTPIEQQRLRSVYANFLRSTHLIHGESSSYDSYVDSQWRYCFSNEDVDLHTCHTHMGSGNFVAKEMVSRFIKKYNKSTIMDKVYADIYFTVYMNQIPYQLEGHGTLVKELDKKEMEHMNRGLNVLYNDLNKDGLVPLQPYIDNVVDHHARASCGFDQCLFLTNKQVFPDIEIFSYNPTIGVATAKQMHEDYLTEDGQNYFYSYAVNGDDHTSWKSAHNVRAGDYIGLDLLMPMRIPLKYRLLVRHPYIKLHPSPHVKCENTDFDETLVECHFIVSETGYRYIRLESQKDLDFKFEVYDLSFSGKVRKDKNGQLLDISFEDDGIAFVEDK
ncbi:hypothetical protein CU098_011315 [Rhizopus stolonifer]|uniref:Uncharacterized protein n=1 Tax=Rhizopus stolonifer TaxID=4846 RepID=A0A367KJK8_RHIST|nr:hypothetical protein CU098_011315 [Rhizopus stolonifer]